MNVDFIAVASCCIYQSFEREIFALDMMEMPEGGHNAENIQIATEKMVNRFDFDKSKIQGINLN